MTAKFESFKKWELVQKAQERGCKYFSHLNKKGLIALLRSGKKCPKKRRSTKKYKTKSKRTRTPPNYANGLISRFVDFPKFLSEEDKYGKSFEDKGYSPSLAKNDKVYSSLLPKDDKVIDIEEIINKNSIVIIGKSECHYCIKAKEKLEEENTPYEYVEYDKIFKDKLLALNGNYQKVPMIFHNTKFMKGYDEFFKNH
jgi:glutaredoxin